MTQSIYIECPHCKHCEGREFYQGDFELKCSSCPRYFRVKMNCVTVHEKGKTTLDLTAYVVPVRSNQVQFNEAAA